jgi:N-acylneuraminate cytidylyltransferase
MKIAALIAARIGSKRLPKKNIRALGGRPLLFWSIDIALRAEAFSEICVSTESAEVIELVRRRYSESEVKVVVRPPELATDEASLNDVCRHYLDRTPDVDFLFLMMPTYPFRRVETIKERILPALYSKQINRVISVNPGAMSTGDYWIETEKGFQRMFKMPALWCSVGNAAYQIMRREYFMNAPHKWPGRPDERTLRVETDEVESVDIDTPEDFLVAEQIVSGKNREKRTILSHETESLELVLPDGVEPNRFIDFLASQKIDLQAPVLILKTPPPYFTFLRTTECSMGKNYFTDHTKKIIASLPESGHSQDFPPHYIHCQEYRVFRKGVEVEAGDNLAVPSDQIIFFDELRKWGGYKSFCFWRKP